MIIFRSNISISTTSRGRIAGFREAVTGLGHLARNTETTETTDTTGVGENISVKMLMTIVIIVIIII